MLDARDFFGMNGEIYEISTEQHYQQRKKKNQKERKDYGCYSFNSFCLTQGVRSRTSAEPSGMRQLWYTTLPVSKICPMKFVGRASLISRGVKGCISMPGLISIESLENTFSKSSNFFFSKSEETTARSISLYACALPVS